MLELLQANWGWFIMVGLAMAVYWISQGPTIGAPPPYQRRTHLLTPAELDFYKVLQSAVGGSWSIFAMVRLSDLIQTKPKTPERFGWSRKIHGKHVDFVLCDSHSLETRLTIELDDKSHQRPDRQARDQFVDEALSAAGLPLMRVPVSDHYSRVELRKAIDEKLGLKKK